MTTYDNIGDAHNASPRLKPIGVQVNCREFFLWWSKIPFRGADGGGGDGVSNTPCGFLLQKLWSI